MASIDNVKALIAVDYAEGAGDQRSRKAWLDGIEDAKVSSEAGDKTAGGLQRWCIIIEGRTIKLARWPVWLWRTLTC